MINRSFAAVIVILSFLISSDSYAQFVVFDPLNTTESAKNVANTKGILEENIKILTTVNKTLEAITGVRKLDSETAKNVAVGDSFSVTNAPSSTEKATQDTLDIILSSIKIQLDGSITTDLKTKKSSLAALAKSTIDINALIKGILSSIKKRKSSLEAVSSNIGNTKDIKGSIDINTQMQVQNGLILNELIGVTNAGLSENQAESQRRVTDIFNSMKAMTYNE